MLTNNSHTAFTLLELLIYMAMAAILLAIVGSVGVSVLSNKARLNTLEDIGSDGRFVSQRVIDLIDSADSVNFPNYGSASSSISLAMAETTKNPTIISVQNNRLMIKEGASTAQALTIADVQVSSLNFTNMSVSPEPATIRSQITLSSQSTGLSDYNLSRTFVTTTNIRKQ